MKQDTYTPKGVFRDLVSMSWSLNYFLNKDKEYNTILKYIIDKKLCDVYPLPKIKDVLLDIGISYSRFSRLILMLYEDILSDEDFHFEKPSAIYELNFSGKMRSFTLSFKELAVIPRIGESVYFSYLKELSQNTYFYVKNVNHRFYKGIQSVEIELEEGEYNLFWHLRRDEAFLKEEINPFNRYEFSVSELKEKLGFIPSWKKKRF